MRRDFHAAGDGPLKLCAAVDLYVGIDRWGFEEGHHRYPAEQNSRTGTGTGLGIARHLWKNH